ncbi:RDD family protein [Streptomyces sp. WM6378]|uniref:RDD family protein n=1 Tax=Streptomyces sp. WM6378 TaxID=1415557 RepID=UPI00099CA517|nr:RDD family protein [Streptomyces sp. WM6378]
MSAVAHVDNTAGLGRRYASAVIDGVFFSGCGLVSAVVYVGVRESGILGASGAVGSELLAGFAVGALIASFLNHVVMVCLAHRSVGKALVGTRVVRRADGGRPRVHQAVARWLGGFLFGVVVLPLAFILGGSEAEPQDFAGLRIIRSR